MLRFPFKGSVSVPQAAAGAVAPWKPFGHLFYLRPDNPAPGDNLNIEIGRLYPGKAWKFCSVACQLTADANIANRFVGVGLSYPDADTVWNSWADTTALTANQQNEYFWGPSMVNAYVATYSQQGSLPDAYFPTQGMRFFIFVGNRAAGDTITEITICVDEWDV